jgi:hypothetical protein
MGTSHLDGDAAFIQEHQAFHLKLAHLLAVRLALGGNLGPLLGRIKDLFGVSLGDDLSASQMTARHTVTQALAVLAAGRRCPRSSAGAAPPERLHPAAVWFRGPLALLERLSAPVGDCSGETWKR